MLSQELSECLGAQEKQWLFSKLPEVKDVSERWSNVTLMSLHSPCFVPLTSVTTSTHLSAFFSAHMWFVGFFRTWSTDWRKTFCDLMCATSSWITARLCEGFTYRMWPTRLTRSRRTSACCEWRLSSWERTYLLFDLNVLCMCGTSFCAEPQLRCIKSSCLMRDVPKFPLRVFRCCCTLHDLTCWWFILSTLNFFFSG